MPHVAADSTGVQNAPLVRAAAYARMSTDHQIYSIENQLAAIREYAERNHITVVREYLDPGRSGLDLKGRPGLVRLLTDVQEGRADYEVILIYDVSRWGRFQDIDESAYYEYACRKANVGVVYCAEPFRNETGDALAAIIKNIKRVMAAEYSREQSIRVLRAQRYVASKGFHSGGLPPYGFQRMLVATDGTRKFILERGKYKAVSGERITLVPGPIRERRLVRRIYNLYVKEHLSPKAIADKFNREGKRNGHGRPWHYSCIKRMLSNEAYLGTLVFNRLTSKFRANKRKNDPSNWVRVEKAFAPIVSREMFAAAAAELRARGHRCYTDQDALDLLSLLLKKRGRLSGSVIRQDKDTPDVAIYKRHFGGLRRAYARIGYKASRDYWRFNKPLTHHLHSVSKSVGHRLIEAIWERGGRAKQISTRRGVIMIDGKLTVSIAVARYLPPANQLREKWVANCDRRLRADYMVIVRMDRENKDIVDYFFMPESEAGRQRTVIRAGNFAKREPYRCTSFTMLLNRVLSKTPILSR